MPENKSIACFDFDGTLIPFNSFKPFLAYSILWMLVRLQVTGLTQVLKAGLSKATGKLDHLEFKKVLCKSTSSMSATAANRFSRICLLFLRPALAARIQAHGSQGTEMVLCTAAPHKYASEVAKQLGFHRCIAFDTPEYFGSSAEENIKGEKLKRFRRHYDALEVMYGDHSDDLNLMEFAGSAFAVHPSPKQRNLILAALPTVKILE